MGKRTIPEKTVWTCDGCAAEEEYKSRPKHWITLNIQRDAYDRHDVAVADASVSKDLCQSCGSQIISAINGALQLGSVR